MAKIMVQLIFPQNLIKKPVIYTMAKKYEVVPNIRRAKVTETVGEVTLEISGTKENLEKAKKYLQRNKVRVEPVFRDIVE
ncbi:MAG: NIL domain-containing protein [bacterium]|nr:NIL domain-containing protein [bacterium]